MSESLQIVQIQKLMQKETSSISILNHFTQNHHKCLQFMFNAQYQVILESFQFKHASYLQKKFADNAKVQHIQEIMRKYDMLSQKNHHKIIKHNSQVDRILNRLQFEWAQKQTHYFHRYYFEKYIDNDLTNYLESLEKILLNEEKLIKSDMHIIHAIDRAIKARQVCLNQAKRVIGTLTGADIEDYLNVCDQRVYYYQSRKEKLQYNIYGYKINKVLDNKISKQVFNLTKFQQFGRLINHYRKLTLHVVALIVKWKQYIYSLTFDHQKHREPVDYYYGDHNYLLKIINDNVFVSKSFLHDYFRFSPKNDPFLIMPLIKLENDELNQTKGLKHSNQQQQTNSKQLRKLKCLKRVLAPQSQTDLIEILQHIQILTTEYQSNIKKRKTFDLRTIHKINNLDVDKSFKNMSKSQVKLNFKQRTDINMTKSTVSSLKSSSLKLSKLSTSKPSKTVESGQLSPLKRQNTSSSLLKKKTLMKLSNPQNNKDTSIFSRQNSFHPSNPQIRDFLKTRQKMLPQKVVNQRQLQSIKQEIKQKIKSQLKLTHDISHNGIFKKPQLASYIDEQVNKMISQSQQVYHMNNMMSKLSKNTSLTDFNPKNPIFVDTYSIQESELSSHLKGLFEEQSLVEYESMQYSLEELMKGRQQNGDKRDLLENLTSLYFLKVKEKLIDSLIIQEKTVSSVIFTLKYLQKPVENNLYRKNQIIQRTAQILFMTIKSHNVNYTEKAIIKTVEFIFKYQTANLVLFTFFYRQNSELEKQKITDLKQLLQKKNCLICERIVYKRAKKNEKKILKKGQDQQTNKFIQVKICFSRKQYTKQLLSTQTHENLQRLKQDPLSLNIKLHGLFSQQKLNLIQSLTESQQRQILSKVNYDYLLTQILKNHVDSNTFRTIGQNQLWQHRLRAVIENILMLRQKEKGQETIPFLELEILQSIKTLNQARKLLEKPYWDNISDVETSNLIRQMSMELKMTLPYLGRAFINSKGKPYFRFQIRDKIQVLNMQYSTCFKQKLELEQTYEQKIYLFECLEKKNIRIGLFDATKISQFIDRENTKLAQSNKKQAMLTLSDLINSLSFTNTQNHGRSMKLMYRQDTYINNMFIPMINPEVPENSSLQSNINSLNPIRIPDLKSISKNESNQFIFSDNVLWNYDVCLENGVRYDCQKERNALVFETGTVDNQPISKQLGIVVFLIPQFIVMYSKII